MKRKIYLLGFPGPHSYLSADDIADVISGLDCSLQRLDPTADDAADVLRDLALDPDFLAALPGSDIAAACLTACHELSVSARACGLIDIAAGVAESRLHGDSTLIQAIAALLKAEGAGVVRTALILGGGSLARAAVGALRELGCARYVIGYETAEELAELELRFRQVRKVIGLFPLEEMSAHFIWSEANGAFFSEHVPPTESGGAERALDKGAKRWELVVNTTELNNLFLPATRVANHNFLSTVNRVLDMRSTDGHSNLDQLALSFGIPAYTAQRLGELQAGQVRTLLVRLQSGEQLVAASPRRHRRRYVLKRGHK